MVDFSISPELEALKSKVSAFVREKVIPMEKDLRQDRHGPSEELRSELIEMTRAVGLLSPHAPKEWGGLGLNHFEMAVIFEAACYSTLGAVAFNIHAPDEGNTNLFNKIATPEQNEKWLRPMVAGKIRTVFAMTEPDNGAGSDPSLMKTEARPQGENYVINGLKWLITGYAGGDVVIVMAKTFNEVGDDLGATMFFVPIGTPGMSEVRRQITMDRNSPGGHSVVEFKNVVVPAANILGQLGKGFRNAQVRLGPARLTHCMRWLGQAQRCHDIAVNFASKRMAFGKPILQHQGIGFQLADNEIELNLCRLATWHCAWLLDQGEQARKEVSQCKVFCSEALGRVVDRSLQTLGGMGITDETVVEQTYSDIRSFRLYDGPSEVHRFVLARRLEPKADQVDHVA